MVRLFRRGKGGGCLKSNCGVAATFVENHFVRKNLGHGHAHGMPTPANGRRTFESVSMFENRNLRLDLLAIGLLASVVFLGLALLTYNPADPVPQLIAPFNAVYTPDQLVYPQPAEATNFCGRWGALAADALLNSLGLGAYYFVVSIGVLDYLLLRRAKVDSLLMRTTGWVLSVLGVVTLFSLVVPAWSPGPVVGSGGYVGAMISGVVRLHFATAGGLILCLSLIIGGLMLCSDYALLHVAATLGGAIFVVAKNGGRSASQRIRPGQEIEADEADEADDEWEEEWEEDVEEDVEQSDEETPLSVRIRGRSVDRDGANEDQSEEEFEFEEDEEFEEGEETLDEGEDESEWEDDEEESVEADLALPVKNHAEKTQRTDESHEPTIRKRSKSQAKSEHDLVRDQLDEDGRDANDYELPGLDLLESSDAVDFDTQAREVRRKAKVLEKTFQDFGFNVKVVEIETGPVIAQFEVELEAGLRLSKITGLADDLAIALRVPSVRIVAPIPGKNSVGIEVPNSTRQMVRLREVVEEANGKAAKMRIPIYLGKDVSGNPLVVDLSTMPHLLIAGRTGTGKSVCLNAIITSMLMTRRPDEVRMLMIDPKMVELSGYSRLPHLMHPVVTDMRKAEAILAWAVEKMEERYQLLAKAGVRHISSFNQLGEAEVYRRLQPEDEAEKCGIPTRLPFIVVVADEIADLMMTSGKEVEQHIIRLAQKSRAVGIHLILATQKPTVDVITGLIKSNLPARLSFQVASRTDSRVVLDEMGAEKLLGNGDMLFLWPGTSTVLRGQGTYLSDEEIDAVVDSVSTGEQEFVNELVNLKVDDDQESGDLAEFRKRDELYEKAIDVVVRERRGSLSLLQRALGIGYGRAARLVDFMAEDGIVGAYAGSQAREVVLTMEDWERIKAGEPLVVGNGRPTTKPPTSQPRKTKANSPRTPDPSKANRHGTARRSNIVRPTNADTPWDEEGDLQDDPEHDKPALCIAQDAASSPAYDDGPAGFDSSGDDEQECDEQEYEEQEYKGEEDCEGVDDEQDEYEEGEYEEGEYEEGEYEEGEYEEDEPEEGEYEEGENDEQDEYEEGEYEDGEEGEREEGAEDECEADGANEEDEYEQDEYEESA